MASCSKTSVTSSMSPSSSSSASNPIIGKRSRIDELDAKSRTSLPEKAISPDAIIVAKGTVEKGSETEKKTCGIATTTNNDEPSLRLCLRLPGGGKESISMCANDTIEVNYDEWGFEKNLIAWVIAMDMSWNANIIFQDFIRRMESMGYAPSEHTYLIPFPKTNLGAIPSQTRLSETILYPANTVFITKI